MLKKYRFKGSYTVEASFLLPMILTVIVLIIYLAFFLHDRQVLYSAAYTSALRGSQLINGEDIYSQVEKSAGELIKNRLIGTGGLRTDIEINSDRITVAYDGSMRIPAGALLCRYLNGGKEVLDVRAKAESKCVNPAGFIRKCRIVENMAKKVKDISGDSEADGEE